LVREWEIQSCASLPAVLGGSFKVTRSAKRRHARLPKTHADFYLDIVNGEYKKSLPSPLTVADIASKSPRILVRLGKYLEQQPLQCEIFNHFRPARYLSEHLKTLEGKISDGTLDRFEKAFVALNKLIR
jgi:hypothetical protein